MSKLSFERLRDMIKEVMLSESYSHLLERPEFLDEASILKNKYPFKAIYIFGPAGAGKGHVSEYLLNIPKDFQVSNPDERIEEVFPVFGISMKFANSEEGGDAELETLQQKSRDILQGAERAHVANLISIANPLVFDTTGEKVQKMVKRIQAISKLGYDVAVFMINVPTEASVERDVKRKRTVGKTRTTDISQKYQKDVVQHNGYYNALESMDNVTMLSSEIYNNIFNLGTGELLDKPTVITPEMLPDDLNPEKNPDALKKEKATMEEAIKTLATWVSTPVENPAGQALLKGMRSLVKKSGGKLGQNMNDLVIAMANPEFQADEAILAAAEHLSSLGGASVIARKTKTGGRMRRGASQDAPYLQQAIRGKKELGGSTVRDMTGKTGPRRGLTQEESLDYDDLLVAIREVLANEL
jgi:hypothetical protein